MDKLITEISLNWCADDIKSDAKEIDVELTDKEVSDVLSSIKANHDPMYGVTWDTIREAIRLEVSEREV